MTGHTDNAGMDKPDGWPLVAAVLISGLMVAASLPLFALKAALRAARNRITKGGKI